MSRNNIIGDGRKTVTLTTVPEPLVAASAPCDWVAFTALPGNAGNVWVGPAANSTALSEQGVLVTDVAVKLPCSDLNEFEVAVSAVTEGLTYIYGSAQ